MSNSVNMPHFIGIGQTVADIWRLVVFITVQNVVGIDAVVFITVVFIMCTFFDVASLACKRLFTPQNCIFFCFLGVDS